MEVEFRLHHGSATTEKAAQAAGRVEAIVGDVVNGNRKAWGRIDVEDVALLVQHARDAAASPDWLSKMAIDPLVTRWEAAKAERDAATARAEAAEQRAAAAEAEVARLRARWDKAVTEVSAMAQDQPYAGLALTPRRSPATQAALREVALVLATGRLETEGDPVTP